MESHGAKRKSQMYFEQNISEKAADLASSARHYSVASGSLNLFAYTAFLHGQSIATHLLSFKDFKLWIYANVQAILNIVGKD